MLTIRDTLLQRYSMLLGRVQQLSAYIAQEAKNVTGPGGRPLPPGAPGAPGAAAARPPGAPPGSSGPGAPGGQGAIERSAPPPALAHYLVHALRTLPADCNPVAPDVLFQVINTMQLPQLEESQKELLADNSAQRGSSSFLSLPGQVKLHPLEDLRKLDDVALARLTNDMRARLKREKARADVMIKEIQRREEEFDWAFRITEDDEDEEKDDLFDDDEDDGDVKMKEEQQAAKEEKPPNPREGWKVSDYLRFLDSGKLPDPARPPTNAASSVGVVSPPTGTGTPGTVIPA